MVCSEELAEIEQPGRVQARTRERAAALDREFADMRQSGPVGATAGGAYPQAVSAKIANTLAGSTRLRKKPVDLATVREADAIRRGSEPNVARTKRDEICNRVGRNFYRKQEISD